jgi:hypothetical protein
MTNYKTKEVFQNLSSNDLFATGEHQVVLLNLVHASFTLHHVSCILHDLFYPQHPAEVSLQSHVGGPPVTILFMIAAAQPTPAFTVIAPNSQFMAQAPHSMHRSLSVIAARLSRISKTICGQTSTHLPQPVHLS